MVNIIIYYINVGLLINENINKILVILYIKDK